MRLYILCYFVVQSQSPKGASLWDFNFYLFAENAFATLEVIVKNEKACAGLCLARFVKKARLLPCFLLYSPCGRGIAAGRYSALRE